MIRTHAIVRDGLLVLSILGVGLLPQAARAATITFSDMTAEMLNIPDPATGGGTVSLLVNSSLFGQGGFAGGQFQVENAGVTPPDDGLWLAVSVVGAIPPDDNTPVLTFTYDDVGNVSGIEPQPFLLSLAIPNGAAPTIFGALNFSGVSGTLGSLNLEGVVVDTAAGETFAVDPFTINAVPLPAAAWLFLTALAGLGLFGWRRRRGAA